MFPPTSLTLLQKLAVEVTGSREAAWVRFFGLYTPAIRRFVERNDKTHDPDDVIQEVYLKLVEILQSGKYQPDKARFRTFLAMLIRRQLISLYRHDQARGGERNLSLDALQESYDGRAASMRPPPAPPPELFVSATQHTALDLQWARAKHEAAVEHVLTKTALSPQSKAVYRALCLENRPVEEVVSRFGISANSVYTIKFRVEKRIEVVEEEFADEEK